MNEYNFIPIGDHCAISEILKDLGLRKCSYPFDWISHTSLIHKTNLLTNAGFISELMEKHDVKEIVQKLIGNAFEPGNNKIFNNMWFPHDEGEKNDIIAKYERRFERLYNDIHDKQNIFIMLTRHKTILETEFISILSYNKNNKILFISGSDHPYLNDPKYSSSVIFKHIFYDIKKLNKQYTIDYTQFRPAIKEFMRELFSKMGYTVIKSPVIQPPVIQPPVIQKPVMTKLSLVFS
jgi:hypothetical protein